jgi:hypothetical protein
MGKGKFMSRFLQLEGGYLVIVGFILLVTIFVATRPFVAGGKNWKKAVLVVAGILMPFIFAHFYMTTTRMDEVQTRFKNGKPVICESRAIRKVAQSVIINPKLDGWYLEGDLFKSPHYTRGFHSARCIAYEENSKKN